MSKPTTTSGWSRRTVLSMAAGTAAAGVVGVRGARAAWPTDPITVIVPYAPGSTDQLVRILGQQMEKILGKPVVVETKPGAGGSVGATYVAKNAKPDGHTLLFAVTSVLTVAPHQNKLPYGFADLRGVAQVTTGPNMMGAYPGAPFKDLTSLVAYAKANPDKVSYGSAGTGGATHLAGAAFARAAGIKLNHIPFQGVTPAVTATVGGTVDLALGFAQAIWPQVQGKRLTAIAQFGATRAKVIPDVPTFRDAGIDLVMPPRVGFLAPARTPDDVVAKIADAARQASAAPEFVDFAKRALAEVEFSGPEAFQRDLVAEDKFYLDLLRDLGMAK
ncbi:tripartite tricarboxylate transporter substrate binding protein [Rhodoplanes sp. TEM]|uniref:Tripartite tricarboxylate transporter substrate binding protein n=1 Tax=Rhodoplanes tepidamans TaxID=200616 RepID=A0ABT5J812_RHOTP|nr:MULTISPECIES: tripartite tricarboxylate transporter substrate binding protein [Rhodoplanes]MDC7785617.1 tripartite tricarboxylate transporter substrate binding protein [Rhodoplanes tepidamans]MDC7985718.1 tripartite tricarboxylate transporter substrate binding protein [Rhodoplanes sp. TEM]MDQ0354817.1 tripartite-type tricarboxylate transporter receptor subunit TctC [Rhodoplanes tepidamans]